MTLNKLSNTDLAALYTLAKEMQIKEYNWATVNSDGVKESRGLSAAFNRIVTIEEEIKRRLSELD